MRENIREQTDLYKVFEQRLNEGKSAKVDVLPTRQILEQTQSIVPLLETGKRQASNRLCILLGMPPSNLESLLGQNGKLPVTPKEVAVGVPADLLRQRPDVRRAERRLAAQTPQIGVAVSDLYPHITLLGTIGFESEHLSDLFDSPASMIGSVGPGVRWDILNYGRLVNNIAVQDARFQELAYAYQDRVLNAGREVEDGLVAFLQAQQRADDLNSSQSDAKEVVDITSDAIKEGKPEYVRLYLFQWRKAEQQDLFAAARGDIALSLIRVYRALGGGWQIRLAHDGEFDSPTPPRPVDPGFFPIEDIPLPAPLPEPDPAAD